MPLIDAADVNRKAAANVVFLPEPARLRVLRDVRAGAHDDARNLCVRGHGLNQRSFLGGVIENRAGPSKDAAKNLRANRLIAFGPGHQNRA